MPSIKRCPLPDHALIHQRKAPTDFLDGYAVPSTLSPQDAAEIAFDMPRWAKALLYLRNILVAPLGLKTGTTTQDAIFPIEHDTADELILGTNDTHLNFRITLLRASGHIHMGTWVRCNNCLGRTYLALVMPFHALITRNAMRRIARA